MRKKETAEQVTSSLKKKGHSYVHEKERERERERERAKMKKKATNRERAWLTCIFFTLT